MIDALGLECRGQGVVGLRPRILPPPRQDEAVLHTDDDLASDVEAANLRAAGIHSNLCPERRCICGAGAGTAMARPVFAWHSASAVSGSTALVLVANALATRLHERRGHLA